MFKALLKKQFLELGFAWIRRGGKRTRKSAVIGIVYVALFAVLMISFSSLALSLAGVLLPAGLDWLYFSLTGMIAILFGVLGSVFNTYATLYNARDNELLLAMPIPPSKLLAARMLGVFAMGLLYALLVMLPAAIVYWILSPVTALRLLGPAVLILDIAVFILTLSLVLGWVVALIASRLKNKSAITVLVSLAFFALYYVVYFRAMTYFQEFAQHMDAISHTVRTGLYPFYQMGLAGAGNPVSLAIVTLTVAAAFALVCWVLSRSFLHIVTVKRGEKKAVYRERAVKAASAKSALLRREFRHFTGNANYMLNCALGTVMMLGASVLVIVKAPQLREAVGRMYLEDPMLSRLVPVILAGASFLLIGMNDITAPSVSLEGKGIWLAQSLPLRAWDVLQAKQKLHILITMPAALLFCLSISLAAGLPAAQTVLLCVSGALFVLLSAASGLAINLLRPNLTWINESVPLKQSMSVLFALMSGWLLAAIMVVPYLFLGKTLSPELYLAICLGVLALLTLGLNLWLKRKGAAIFENL